MRQSLSVVLERNTTLSGGFTTEPYEVAWASEARWFIRALDMGGQEPVLQATTQVSPDGLHWCDLDDHRLQLSERGMATMPAREFGGWLRLKGEVTGASGSDSEATAKVLIYLVLKD